MSSQLIHQLRLPVIALALFAAGVMPANATTVDRVSTRDRIVLADLIIEGVVTSVQYRNSDVLGRDDVALPHTFVTFAVERSFKGSSSAGDQITLRLMGGPDGTGRHMRVVGIPQFRPGDREILFIQGNGTVECPLVGWYQGRLRVVRGEVFDDFGREVWLSPSGDILGGEVLIDEQNRPIRQAGAEAEETQRFVPPAGALRPDSSGFANVLHQMTLELYARGEMEAPLTTPSLVAAQPFRVKPLVAVGAPARSNVNPGDDVVPEEERRERELEKSRSTIRRNDG